MWELKVKSYLKKLPTAYCLLPTKKGFTLIETIMVMVIIVILAAVVIIRNPFGDIKLYSATRKVAADIRYVQKLAISNQTRAGMTFNANGYNVSSDITVPTAATSPGDPCSTSTTNTFVVNFADPTGRCSNYNGVTLTAPATNPIAFNSLGTPVTSGGVVLVPPDQLITVTYNGTKQINIEANTGRVSY